MSFLYFIACLSSIILVRCENHVFHEFAEINFPLQYDRQLMDAEIPKKPHFIMFYAPWCGHCQRVSSTFAQLAQKYNLQLNSENAIIAKVDCTLHTALCSDHGVLGYPTLLFFWPETPASKKYKGKRDFESLDKFIQLMIETGPPAVSEETTVPPKPSLPKIALYELTEETFDEHIMTGQHFVKFYAPWCSHCKTLAPTWNLLADIFSTDDSVTIAKVDCTEHRSVCSKNMITGYPSLIYFNRGLKMDEYKGSRDLKSLKEFVIMMKAKVVTMTTDIGHEGVPDYDGPNVEIISDTEGQDTLDQNSESQPLTTTDGPAPHEKIITEKSAIVPLTVDNFVQRIHATDVIHVVLFHTPWCPHCQTFRPVWQQLPGKLRESSVTFSEVDCVEQQTLCSSNSIQHYPTILFYHNGAKIDTYKGIREIHPLSSYIYNLAHMLLQDEEAKTDAEAGVLHLSDQTFSPTIVSDQFTFVAFVLPWCIQCKHLITVWQDLSRTYTSDTEVTIAKVNCQLFRNLCPPDGVDHYPILVLYHHGERVADYSGKRDLESLKQFVADTRRIRDEL